MHQDWTTVSFKLMKLRGIVGPQEGGCTPVVRFAAHPRMSNPRTEGHAGHADDGRRAAPRADLQRCYRANRGCKIFRQASLIRLWFSRTSVILFRTSSPIARMEQQPTEKTRARRDPRGRESQRLIQLKRTRGNGGSDTGVENLTVELPPFLRSFFIGR